MDKGQIRANFRIMVCSGIPNVELGSPFFKSVYVAFNSEEDLIGLGK